MDLSKRKKLRVYLIRGKKGIRYLRWAVKAAFLILFTVPIFYLVKGQKLSVASFFFVKPTGQISGFTTIQEFFMVPIGQSQDSIWLSYYGNANPGYWIIEPFGGLQTLLTGQVRYSMIIPTIIAALIFVIVIVLLGNVFCSWVCPIGTIIDSFDKGIEKFFPKIEGKRKKRFQQRRENSKKKRSVNCIPLCPVNKLTDGVLAKGILASSLIGSVVFRFPVFCAFCPIGIVSRGLFHFKAMMSITGKWMVWWLEMLFVPVVAVVLSLRERRFFCRRICPVGMFLSMVGSFNPFIKPRVKEERCIMKGCPEDCKDSCLDICLFCRLMDDKKCEKVCPVDIDLVDHGSLAKCTKCLECYVVCPYDAISIDLLGKPDIVQSSYRFLDRIRTL